MSKGLEKLQQLTKARVALGHFGSSIPTREILKFNYDHALARDAVHAVWDVGALQTSLKSSGEQEVIQVASAVLSREDYLKRPDLGRVLNAESRAKLSTMKAAYDVAFIVSDGLSATAIERHFLPFWLCIKEMLLPYNFKIAPIVLAPFSRVALSDEVGFYLNATASIILIGERPGLTASDSLGIYLTYGPTPGNMDSARNCISNIRPPDGLSYEGGAKKLIFLLMESMRRKLSGVMLKEEESALVLSEDKVRQIPSA